MLTHISYRNEWAGLSGTDDSEEDARVSWERQTRERMKTPHKNPQYLEQTCTTTQP